jgi:hypothetical protein
MAQPYSWTAAYERAQNETDPTKLQDVVMAAEEAMVQRRMELSRDEVGAEAELVALRSAATELLKIKTDKLGWPSIDSASQR